MIRPHDELQKEVNLFNETIKGKGFLQKIYSTSRYVSFSVRVPGASCWIYLGRGGGYEGLWRGKAPPPSALRIRDRFLEYLRKHLVGTQWVSLELDPNDRILVLVYKKFSRLHEFLFFWKGRSLYFLHHFFEEEKGEWQTFLSWKGAVESFQEEIPLKTHFDSLGRISSATATPASASAKEGGLVKESPSVDSLLKEELKGLSGEKERKKAKKFLQRKREKIENDLRKISLWRKLQEIIREYEAEEGSLDHKEGLHLGGTFLKFKKEFGHYKRLDFLYDRMKRWRSGEEIQRGRLAQCLSEIEKAETVGFQPTPQSRPKIIEPVWSSAKSGHQGKEGSASGASTHILEIFLGGGIKMGVGKNDQGNDFLRNKWGKKEDYWFHLEGYRGSHGVVRVKSMAELSMVQLRIIGSCLADYSHVGLQVIPLVYAPLKNVKGAKGERGKVILKKQKYYHVDYDPDWKGKIPED